MVDRDRIARSTLWSMVENGGLAIVSFVSLVIYSRLLSPADFGMFSIALAIIEIAAMLVSMAFHDALVQRPDATNMHFDTAFTATCALSLVLMLLCWPASYLLERFGASHGTAYALMGCSVSLPLTAVGATIVARQRRELNFRALAIRSLVGRTVGSALGIAAIVWGAGMEGLVVQQVSIVLFGSLVLWLYAERRPRLRFRKTEFRQLANFGGFSVAAMFLAFAIKRGFVVLCGLELGPERAGLLNLSFRAVDTFWAIAATAVSQVALPTLVAMREDPERRRKAFALASTFSCAILFFCFAAVGASSADVVSLLFGPRWIGIAPYVAFLAVVGAVQTVRLLAPSVLSALGRPKSLLVSQFAEFVALAAAIIAFGIPNIRWAIGLWLFRELLGGLIVFWQVKNFAALDYTTQLKGIVSPSIASMITIAVMHVLSNILPPDWHPGLRLAILIPMGAGFFALGLGLVDRKLLSMLYQFALRAVHRDTRPAA